MVCRTEKKKVIDYALPFSTKPPVHVVHILLIDHAAVTLQMQTCGFSCKAKNRDIIQSSEQIPCKLGGKTTGLQCDL